MNIRRIAGLLAFSAVSFVFAQAQDFTTAFTGQVFRGTKATLSVRISHAMGPQKVTSLRIDFAAGAAGSKPNFSILIDHGDQLLKVADGNGQIFSPYMNLEEGRSNRAFTSSGVTISEYTFSRHGNSYSLNLEVTRPSLGDADLNVTLLASDGSSNSLPGAKTVAAVWKMGVPFCEPSAQQLANRISKDPLPVPPLPRLPEPGEKYCDPTFGTELLRLSDNFRDPVLGVTNNINVVAPLGQLGFNKNATRFALLANNGQLRIHSLDPEKLTSSPGRYIDPLMINGLQANPNSSAILWSGSSAPDAPDTILFGFQMGIYKVNIAQPVNGQYRAALIADLSSLLEGNQDSNPKIFGRPSLMRCSASRDTYTIGCSILIATPGGAYPRLGYVIVQLASHEAGRPDTNWQVKAKWINGIDSDDIAKHQVVELQGSDGEIHSYTLTSPYELGFDERGGYKLQVDRSGRYALFISWDPLGDSSRFNTMVVLDLEKQANGEQPFKFIQASGHGDVGFGVFVGITGAHGSCATCMKTWDLATLSSDPVTSQNNGTPLSSPFGYNFGRQYNTYYGSGDQTALVLACPVSGCPPQPDPFSGELLNLKTSGLNITTRLLRINHTFFSNDYAELQPIQSPDSKLIAFTTNFGDKTGKKFVFIVRVPQ